MAARPARRILLAVQYAVLALAWLAAPAVLSQAPGPSVYADPGGRFEFSYPSAWGAPEPGTDSGFGDRVAAIRFAALAAAGGLGGEAVVTRGPVMVDLQALGGLYDPLMLQLFPDATRKLVVAARPPVTPANFCRLLGQADHLVGSAALSEELVDLARQVDRMRNVDPRVVWCEVADGIASFHKETTWEGGGTSARQHLFGAVRFLQSGFSSFQIVRGAASPPAQSELDALTGVARSFRAPRASAARPPATR